MPDSSEEKTTEQQESPAERAAKKLRESQWGDDVHGVRIAGRVLLVAVPRKPKAD